MPNHVTNRLELVGKIKDINEVIKNFSTIVPAKLNMTADDKLVICKNPIDEWDFCWLDLTTGHCSNRKGLDQIGLPNEYQIEINQSFLKFPDFSKVVPPPDDPAYRDEPNQESAKKSPNWWYNWNIENWGSKWGAYEYKQIAVNIFTFQTAWSSAPKIIEKLSKANPKVKFLYSWADEDTSYNVGEQEYVSGEIVKENIPMGGSIQAFEIYFSINPDNKKDYVKVNGNYVYQEQD